MKQLFKVYFITAEKVFSFHLLIISSLLSKRAISLLEVLQKLIDLFVSPAIGIVHIHGFIREKYAQLKIHVLFLSIIFFSSATLVRTLTLSFFVFPAVLSPFYIKLRILLTDR